MKPDKLEVIMRAWAARRTPTGAALAELAVRVDRACLSKPYQEADKLTAWTSARRPRSRLAYLSVGLAAGLALAFMLHYLRGQESAGALHLAQLTPEQVEARRALFGEMETLFTGQLRWCSVSGSDVQLGVSEVRSGLVASPVALVRLVLVHRAKGATGWERVWSNDIVAREQEYVELAPNPQSDNRVSLWLYGNRDGTFVVNSTVALHVLAGLTSQTEAIMRPGIPVELGSLQTQDGDYRIYQEVQTLPEGQGST